MSRHLFVVAVALSACLQRPEATCEETCAGCCSNAQCMAGDSADACGRQGAACVSCAGGAQCTTGACEPVDAGATGGGNGGTGGGAGGGIGNPGCRQIGTLSTNVPVTADYRTALRVTGHEVFAEWRYPTDAGFDRLRIEVVYANDQGPFPPLAQPFTNVNAASCNVCALFAEACTPPGDCGRTYLAQSGTVRVTRGDRAPAGRMVGSGANVHFTQWDLTTDTAVPDGGCVEVRTLGPWDVGWNLDGGAIP